MTLRTYLISMCLLCLAPWGSGYAGEPDTVQAMITEQGEALLCVVDPKRGY